MLWRGKGRLDWSRLTNDAIRVKSQALVQRLGYLADFLHLPLGTPARDGLLTSIGKSTSYLGRPSRWGTGGEYDATWRIVDDVSRQELLAEVEVL
jgi:predicted transcriptional regulator of viral defense system